MKHIERFCQVVADMTSNPVALVAAILIQVAWIIIGTITRTDPFPFVFLLTISNVLQLILIFVLAVAQKQQTEAHQDHFTALHDHLDTVHDTVKDKTPPSPPEKPTPKSQTVKLRESSNE